MAFIKTSLVKDRIKFDSIKNVSLVTRDLVPSYPHTWIYYTFSKPVYFSPHVDTLFEIKFDWFKITPSDRFIFSLTKDCNCNSQLSEALIYLYIYYPPAP